MYCKYCGEQLNSNDVFCRKCGARQENEPVTGEVYSFAPDDVRENKAFAVLAYLGILVIVPIIAARKSPYARFHANQGLVLFLASVIVQTVLSVLAGVFSVIRLGFIFGILSFLVAVVVLALIITGIINAVNGRRKALPILGELNIEIIK